MLVIKDRLRIVPLNQSGWTVFREGGRIKQYIRNGQTQKEEIPLDSRTIVLQENGSQVLIVAPFNLDSLEYYEQCVVEVMIPVNGDVETGDGVVIGGKCIIGGVRLKSKEKSDDGREVLLVFEESTSRCCISLLGTGDVEVKYL